MHLVVLFDGVVIVEVQIAFYRVLEPVCDRLVVARKRVRLHLGFTCDPIDFFTPGLGAALHDISAILA